MAGREDSGLTNAELDRCRTLVTIATDPRHPRSTWRRPWRSWPTRRWNARGGERLPLKPPRHEAAPATAAQLETLFADWHRALWAIDFFKTRRSESVMRSFREIVFRAGLDGREASLLRAMGIEVVRYLERIGAPMASPPTEPGMPPSDGTP